MRIVRTMLIVLLLFCALFFGALVRSRARAKRFAAIAPGTTEASLNNHVGPATRTANCAVLPEPPATCARVMVYAVGIPGVMPEFWLIPLSNDARVVRVFHTTRAD